MALLMIKKKMSVEVVKHPINRRVCYKLSSSDEYVLARIQKVQKLNGLIDKLRGIRLKGLCFSQTLAFGKYVKGKMHLTAGALIKGFTFEHPYQMLQLAELCIAGRLEVKKLNKQTDEALRVIEMMSYLHPEMTHALSIGKRCLFRENSVSVVVDIFQRSKKSLITSIKWKGSRYMHALFFYREKGAYLFMDPSFGVMRSKVLRDIAKRVFAFLKKQYGEVYFWQLYRVKWWSKDLAKL